MARVETDHFWHAGYFTEKWVGQDVATEETRTAIVRVQYDYHGNIVWIHLDALADE